MEKDLSVIVKKLDQTILASAGVDSLEEILKLLFTKIFDESQNKQAFKTYSSPQETYTNIQKLFQKAQSRWTHIYDTDQTINLEPTLAHHTVEILQKINIIASDLSIIDNAIEHLLPKTLKENRGQFLTPRHVVKHIVDMLSPKKNETFLDPACGIGGFVWHTIEHVKKTELKKSSLKEQKKYVRANINGNDFDNRLSRIANLIILLCGGLDNQISSNNFLESKTKKYNIIATNPPFAGNISDQKLLERYTLSKNSRNKLQKSVARHILFLEKIIESTLPGGRIGIIIPQGVLNNLRMQNVHKYLFEKTKLCAVITLDQNTFMPHTNIKTSILILKKWKNSESKKKDYKVFMAISEKSGKNTKGQIVMGKNKIDHDLNTIAKEFAKFKKTQKLHF